MKNYLNIVEKDIFVLDSIDNLIEIYRNHNIESKPFAVIVIQKGELDIEIGLKHHKLMPKQILVYLPLHKNISSYTTSDDFEGKIICLSERIMIENFNLENNIWEKSFALGADPIIDINEEVSTLFECYGKLLNLGYKMSERMYQQEVITSLMKAMIYELLNEVNHTVETPGKHLLKQGDILFKKFITLLSTTEVKPRLVSWYAQQLHVTPKYLSTTCKNVSGKSANIWINQFVIKDISYLLKHSEKSIKEIAEYLEFPNLSFFGKYVKAHLGVSPKEYRAQQRNRK